MDADDLYGLPLDQFIPERTALAKERRATGDRDGAAAVAALRKPSVAAWAVNQLVRTQGKAFGELTAAGDELYRAQVELMEGKGDARSLREVQDGERAAVDVLLKSAHGLLSSDGDELSPVVLERVSDTLHAAALDADAREAVSGGRLERELKHVGLGNLPDVEVSGSGGPRKKRATKKPASAATGAEPPQPPRADLPKPPRAEASSKQAGRERAEARRAARVAEGETRRRAEIAARAVRAAEQRREVAAEALAKADQELADARAEADEATEAHRKAEAELKKSR